MKWILIILMWSGKGGVATTTAEFEAELLCKTAATSVIVKDDSPYLRFEAFCVPKGAE